MSKLSEVEVMQLQDSTQEEPILQFGLTGKTFYRWREQFGILTTLLLSVRGVNQVLLILNNLLTQDVISEERFDKQKEKLLSYPPYHVQY
jgi:hypothetical protein